MFYDNFISLTMSFILTLSSHPRQKMMCLQGFECECEVIYAGLSGSNNQLNHNLPFLKLQHLGLCFAGASLGGAVWQTVHICILVLSNTKLYVNKALKAFAGHYDATVKLSLDY